MLTNIFGRNWASINLIGDIDFRKETNERITLLIPFFFQATNPFRFSLQTTVISNQNESCQYFQIIYYCLLLFFIVFSGNKSPVANGDPHNDTTVSEISADITIDSVKDHTM